MSCQDVLIREVLVSYKRTSESLFKVSGAADVACFARRIVVDNSREHCVTLYLDGSHSVVSYSIVSIGTANSALIHPREVFQPAIVCGAIALIFCHNHPSGETAPSPEDLRATKKLRDAGDLLGIKLLDHVIVTDTSFLSFQEQGIW